MTKVTSRHIEAYLNGGITAETATMDSKDAVPNNAFRNILPEGEMYEDGSIQTNDHAPGKGWKRPVSSIQAYLEGTESG